MDFNINLSLVFNKYILILIGIVLEVIGALLLSYEAIGINKFNKLFYFFNNISNWAKKSFLRLTLFSLPPLVLIGIGFLTSSSFIIGLTIPILITTSIINILIDDHDYFNKMLKRKGNEKTIGPLGYIILATGAFFQLISILIDMSQNLPN